MQGEGKSTGKESNHYILLKREGGDGNSRIGHLLKLSDDIYSLAISI